MPLHYKTRVYKSWYGLIRAIKREHPAWSNKRVNNYAGRLKAKQEGVKRRG